MRDNDLRGNLVAVTQIQIRQILERVLSWPVERQIEVARVLEAIEHSDAKLLDLDEEQTTGIEAAVATANRGEFAEPSEVEALWRNWGA